MKKELPSDREFNTPAEMVVRATFLGMLGALAGGILLTLAGIWAAEAKLSLAGMGVLSVALVGRAWLQSRGELESADRALDRIAESGPAPDEARGHELLALLEQWEALEQKRGSPDFDPWALQVLRNDIRRVVESDPALNRIFTDLQRAA